MRFVRSLSIAAVVLLGFVLFLSAYTVNQTEQVIITQFGKPVGEPITSPGLHLKLPFIQQVTRFDQRYLAWDGPMVEMPTKDKTYVQVETFARWRIKDPMQYYLRLRDERSAQSRLEDILGSETRTAIAKHELIEAVRTDKARQPLLDASLAGASTGVGTLGVLHPIRYGRLGIEKGVIDAAAQKLREFGIELLDVRFKRINYHPQVLERIHQRMISERLQIAQRFRSEEGEAARISGQKERDINEIESTAYKRVQDIRGEADAKATEIYAKAYTQRPEAADFYRFLKSMETYRKIINTDATIILSTNSDLLALLKRIEQKSRD
jgi:membrane protease subunit HflC